MYVLGRVRLACNSRLWGGDKEISGVHWLASLAKLINLRSSERPSQNIRWNTNLGGGEGGGGVGKKYEQNTWYAHVKFSMKILYIEYIKSRRNN